jgi:hypothetical protein
MICLRCNHYVRPDREMDIEQQSVFCKCVCHPWNAPPRRSGATPLHATPLDENGTIITADGYPVGWPRCVWCGEAAMDGHLTCGRLRCSESAARERGL